MVGQHIFVRCKNEQNNAGTWTAAITDNILERNDVKELIEPRCNLNERFAQLFKAPGESNNILRIYHIDDSAMVVSRTFWVSDRITESMGRKGAYTINHILTNDDVLKFCNDFGGAFDPSCFETYDSIVNRIENNKITINENYSLFDHGEGGYDSKVFAKAGFTRDTFIQFMNGIYHAMENNTRLALILPFEYRRAWEERSDGFVEKLAYHVLQVLPDFTRIKFGMATHWNCAVNDKMVGDMHLVFIHPDDDGYAYLKREKIMTLDLDTGAYTDGIPTVSSEYFGFVWDNLANRDLIEEFWKESKSKHRKLLKIMPASASVMECMYLMQIVQSENFANKERTRRAFILAGENFGGSGTKVPDAEEFIYQSLEAMQIAKAELDEELEETLRHIMSYDKEQTKHQSQEYSSLLHACELGTANDETVSALYDEVTRPEKNAAAYYITYLAEKQSLPIENLSNQLIKFVCGVFVKLAGKNSELFIYASELLKKWSDELYSIGEYDRLKPIFDAYSAYINGNFMNADIRFGVYEFLFAYEKIAKASAKDECLKLLFKEEKRLYKSEYDYIDGTAMLRRFSNAFFASLEDVTKMKKDEAEEAYQRLFRMAFKGDGEILEVSVKAYTDAINAAKTEGLTEKVFRILTECQQTTLNEITNTPEIWKPVQVQGVLVMFELLNLNLLPNYFPSSARLNIILTWFDPNDVKTYEALTQYLKRMPLDSRQVIFRIARERNILNTLFLYIMFNENDALVLEADTNLNMSHGDKLRMILGSQLISRLSADFEKAVQIFAKWYSDDLKKNIEAQAATVDYSCKFGVLNRAILEEYRLMKSLSIAVSRFKEEAKNILDKISKDIFASAQISDIVALSPEEVKTIAQIQNEFNDVELPLNERFFRLVERFDSLVFSNDLIKLDEVVNNVNANAELKGAIVERLKYHIQSGAKKDQEPYYWFYYYALTTNVGDYFPLENYFESIGYSQRSRLDKGMMLVKFLDSLQRRNSNFENMLGIVSMMYLIEKIKEDPQEFVNEKFKEGCLRIKTRDYFRQSGIVPYLNRIFRNTRIKFGLPMFLLCLISAIIVCALTAGTLVLMFKLAYVDNLVMISVGSLIFITLLIINICLWPRRNKVLKN